MPKHPDDYKTGSVDLKVEKVVKDEKKVKESDVFGGANSYWDLKRKHEKLDSRWLQI